MPFDIDQDTLDGFLVVIENIGCDVWKIRDYFETIIDGKCPHDVGFDDVPCRVCPARCEKRND